MSKSDPAASKRERNKTIRWVVTIFIVTIFISGAISLLSDVIMENSSVFVAFLIECSENDLFEFIILSSFLSSF